MHCPACGTELDAVDRTAELEEAEERFFEAEDRYFRHQRAMAEWHEVGFEGDPPEGVDPKVGLAGYPERGEEDKSAHWSCPNEGCVLHGTRLNEHHPFRGPLSRSGDSFSLSSIPDGREGKPLPNIGGVHCLSCGETMTVKGEEGYCHNPECTMRSCAWGVKLSGDALTVDWIK